MPIPVSFCCLLIYARLPRHDIAARIALSCVAPHVLCGPIEPDSRNMTTSLRTSSDNALTSQILRQNVDMDISDHHLTCCERSPDSRLLPMRTEGPTWHLPPFVCPRARVFPNKNNSLVVLIDSALPDSPHNVHRHIYKRRVSSNRFFPALCLGSSPSRYPPFRIMSCSLCRLPFTPGAVSADPHPPPEGILTPAQQKYMVKAVIWGTFVAGLLRHDEWVGAFKSALSTTEKYSSPLMGIRSNALPDNNMFSNAGKHAVSMVMTWQCPSPPCTVSIVLHAHILCHTSF